MSIVALQTQAPGTAAQTASTGLIAGTTVLTLDGELPVELLAPGDRVITRGTGMAVLKSIRVERAVVDTVEVAAGSLGHNRPESETLLPAAQEVLIRDWRAKALYGKAEAAVPAARLADGEYVRSAGRREVTLVTLEFERGQVIYAGGLEVTAPAAAPARAA